MIIRDARLADIAMVRRLIGQLADAPDEVEFRARFERVAATPGHRIIVAEMDSEIVGVLHVFERPALEKACEAVVQALVVDGERRGAGIGEALMREAEAWAASRKLAYGALYPYRPRQGADVLRAYRLSPEGDIAPDGPNLGRATERIRADCWHFAGIAAERGPTHGVRPTFRALLRRLCRYASIILPGDDAWLLTELSNVVAYSCQHLTSRGSVPCKRKADEG
jgi:GNAT superfamily N-acetyltransferase